MNCANVGEFVNNPGRKYQRYPLLARGRGRHSLPENFSFALIDLQLSKVVSEFNARKSSLLYYDCFRQQSYIGACSLHWPCLRGRAFEHAHKNQNPQNLQAYFSQSKCLYEIAAFCANIVFGFVKISGSCHLLILFQLDYLWFYMYIYLFYVLLISFVSHLKFLKTFTKFVCVLYTHVHPNTKRAPVNVKGRIRRGMTSEIIIK